MTLRESLEVATSLLQRKGIERARLETEWIAAHVLGLNRLELCLNLERPLQASERTVLQRLIQRRSTREPLAYVLGAIPFDTLELKSDQRALVPRPETEELIDLLGRECRFSSEPLQILDLGTGCGAIALALASRFPRAHVTAVDASPDALALACENVRACNLNKRVQLQQSDWFEAVAGRFDVIVANPPYLSESEWQTAEPEVREHEPRCALVAEQEGAAALLHILQAAPAYLKAHGLLALETGIDHHALLKVVADEVGYVRSRSYKDLSGRDRHFLAWVG